jgi:hypothetical protein
MTKKSGQRRGVVLKFDRPQRVRPNAVVAANTFEAVARKKNIMTTRGSIHNSGREQMKPSGCFTTSVPSKLHLSGKLGSSQWPGRFCGGRVLSLVEK